MFYRDSALCLQARECLIHFFKRPHTGAILAADIMMPPNDSCNLIDQIKRCVFSVKEVALLFPRQAGSQLRKIV